jgi:RNA polymerase sigma-70 factor, ECF subfamily
VDHPALSEAPADLESVYREHHRRVRWLLRARGVAEDALDDVAHDVFLTIHRRLAERDPAVPMAAWISGLARNVAFSHRRAWARRLRSLQRVTEPEPGPGLDEELAQRAAWSALRAFLDELEPSQREVLVLSDLLGMSVPEIADTTNAPLNTLYSRLRLARARLQRRFASEPGGVSAFMGRAGRQERPTPARRRAAWALLAADLGRIGLVPIVGLAGKWAAGLALTVAVGGAAVVATRDAEPLAPEAIADHVHEHEPRVERRDPQVQPVVAAASGEPAPSPLDDPAPVVVHAVRPSARKKAPLSTSSDELAWAVETLRSIKLALEDGRPDRALAEIQADRDRLARGELRRELLRLELRAACAAGRPDIARGAARGLGPTGEPDDDPCAAR